MNSLEEVEASLYRKHQQLVAHTQASLTTAQQALQQVSDTNLDNLVSRNIQDVIASVCYDASRESTSHNDGVDTAEMALEPLRKGSSETENIAKAIPARSTTASRKSSSTAAAAPVAISKAAATQPSCSYDPSSILDVSEHPAATIRLHKAKIQALEQQVADLTQTLTTSEKELASTSKEVQSLRAEKANWSRAQKNLEAQVAKQKAALEEARASIVARDQQLQEVQRGSSQTENERRQIDADARTKSVQLMRAMEEVEHYKKLLQDVKLQDKDRKGGSREDVQRLLGENKKLERQRAQLVVAFKKQLKLIDVLKRQKIHMETARALAFTEEEFLKILEIGSA